MANPRAVEPGTSPKSRRRHTGLLSAGTLLALALAAGFFWVLPLWRAAAGAEAAIGVVGADYAAHQDSALFGQLPTLRTRLLDLQDRLQPFRPLTVVPILGRYIRAAVNDDAAGLDIVQAVLPLRGALRPLLAHEAKAVPHTISALLRAPLQPSAEKLQAAARLLSVPSPGWPKSFALVASLRVPLGRAARAMTALAGVEAPLRSALGLGVPAHYLVMFQDGGELRATGGFYSAWGVLTVDDVQLAPLQVSGIGAVSPDAHLRVPAPFPIRWAFHYQTVSMMDSNFSPNAPTSLQRLERYAATVPGMPHLDGVILVDTWMLEHLLRVLGPVTVPVEPGRAVTVSDRHTEYTVVDVAERLPSPAGTRKQFLTPLADTLMARAQAARTGRLGPQSSATWTSLMTALQAGLAEEHLVLYASNPGLERMLRRVGWAGAMPVVPGQNFLEVVDANYGGLKDNTYMTTRADVTVAPSRGGRVLETVRVDLTLDRAADGWMVGAYNGFVSTYFPPGTTVLSITGSPMKALTRVRSPRGGPVMAGSTIHFPAAGTDGPGTGEITIRVKLPKGLAAFPLVLGKQPGLPVLSDSITWASAELRFAQETAVRIVPTSEGLRTRGLPVSPPPL